MNATAADRSHAFAASGWPGVAPTWTSSAKDMVTTALGSSRVWVTLGYGIINEVYWPSAGRPQIRDLGFLLAGPSGWHEVKRVARYRLPLPKPYTPLPKILTEGEGSHIVTASGRERGSNNGK